MILHLALKWATPVELTRLVRAVSKGNVYVKMPEKLLDQFKQPSLIKARRQAVTKPAHVLETTQLLNRNEEMGETLRRALNHLAIAAPEWLLTQVGPDWFDRYGTLFEQYRPPKKTDLQQLNLTIRRDGQHLLSALDAPHTPKWLRQVPSVELLRSVWAHQYEIEGKTLLCRDVACNVSTAWSTIPNLDKNKQTSRIH